MEFSFKRMLLLLKRKCVMNVWNLLAPVLGTAIFAAVGRFFGWGYETVVAMASLAFLISFAQLPFLEYKTKNSRANQLLLPSSNLEKYISEFVFFFLIYSVVFSLALIVGIAVSSLAWGTFDKFLVYCRLIWHAPSYDFPLGKLCLLNWFMFSALFFNSLLFKKRSALLSFTIGCGLLVVVTVATLYIIEGNLDIEPIISPNYAMKDYSVVFSGTLITWANWFMLICSLFFTVFGYFRLREERA